ncbi:Gfo/Idh/MocA family protein [Flavobacterium sp. S87F.05.LMB.W.Kidney.N]|uniref:Gfo/Idh/MocA family protein n=1 Tax=Flavobacterium sp. S87F.05.LMB.W.Kidney.N TaxID=1278758 RepID=UPI001066B60B|nr:Gfo/Idh/MocA family oxidoreductase [Flavobacterium sp. S87F.05.LMB.W.Kidney.N]TDX11297.1 putative dehydrogenase [Flavobacterium sp. S87F.05.LMB.W.Kidney.N]
MADRKIKWGIVGLGNIASQFASDLLLIDDAELTAVASRDISKAELFAEKFGALRMYNSYDLLFEDSEVEIIYIATPHNSHAELSIKALEKGKHVICEKPMSLSYNDAERMIEASTKNNRFFMEAFWTRFIPSIQEILQKVDNGIIGDVNYIKADFAFHGSETENKRLFDKELGGGALFDIGVYPLFLSYILLGNPKEIIAKAIKHKNDIDLQTSMLLQYESAQSVLHASIVSESDMKASISGSKGRIELNSPWFVADGYSLFINDEKEAAFTLPTLGKGYSHEIIECHNCIRNNQIESKLWSHQNSLDLSRIVEEIKNQIGLSFA